MRKLLLPLSMLFLSSFSFGGTIIVSNVNDSGMGSLRTSISIANSGIYLLRVITNEGNVITKRIVKQ